MVDARWEVRAELLGGDVDAARRLVDRALGAEFLSDHAEMLLPEFVEIWRRRGVRREGVGAAPVAREAGGGARRAPRPPHGALQGLVARRARRRSRAGLRPRATWMSSWRAMTTR